MLTQAQQDAFARNPRVLIPLGVVGLLFGMIGSVLSGREAMLLSRQPDVVTLAALSAVPSRLVTISDGHLSCTRQLVTTGGIVWVQIGVTGEGKPVVVLLGDGECKPLAQRVVTGLIKPMGARTKQIVFGSASTEGLLLEWHDTSSRVHLLLPWLFAAFGGVSIWILAAGIRHLKERTQSPGRGAGAPARSPWPPG